MTAPDYTAIRQHMETVGLVALVTTGRTGTDFFQSLMDGHPQVFGFTGQYHFNWFWEQSACAHSGLPIVAEDIADEFIGMMLYRFRTRYDAIERKGELGETRDGEVDVDRAAFRRHLVALLDGVEISAKTFLPASYAAFALARGEDPLERRVILHHAHRIRGIAPLLRDFPEAKVICMIRDYRANYVSGVENWRRHEPATDNPSYPVYIIWRAVDEANALAGLPADRLRALRLEDLGSRDVLTEIAGWLGIDYDDCMTRSTWGGLRWWGDRISVNSPKSEETGFSPTMISNSWRNKLGRLDIFVLDTILEPQLHHYGYLDDPRHSRWRDLLAAAAILLPTCYERRYLAPKRVFAMLRRVDIKGLLRLAWHPLRRIALFYRWHWRKLAGRTFLMTRFGSRG